MEGPGGSIGHAEMQIGNSRFFLNDEFPGMASAPDGGASAPSSYLFVYSEKVDNDFNQAVSAGCSVTMPLTDQFWGDRFGKLKGSVWASLGDEAACGRCGPGGEWNGGPRSGRRVWRRLRAKTNNRFQLKRKAPSCTCCTQLRSCLFERGRRANRYYKFLDAGWPARSMRKCKQPAVVLWTPDVVDGGVSEEFGDGGFEGRRR